MDMFGKRLSILGQGERNTGVPFAQEWCERKNILRPRWIDNASILTIQLEFFGSYLCSDEHALELL